MSAKRQDPLVSVLLPTARGGRFLREAVESVLRQTEQRWELIIVADGCQEPLGSLAEADDRIRVIEQPRSGVSIARNRALAASTAPFVALLDDDDRMSPLRLERELEVIEASGAGMVHTQADVIDGDGGLLGHGTLHEVQYLDLLRGDVSIVTSSVLLRRSVLDAVGAFDPLLRAGEDLELYLRVARRERLAFIDERLADYRRHGANQYSRASVFQRDVVMIYSKHLNAALRDGDRAVAAAARLGIQKFAALNAANAIGAARQKGGLRGVPHLIEAARLAPASVARRALGAARRRLVPAVLR